MDDDGLICRAVLEEGDTPAAATDARICGERAVYRLDTQGAYPPARWFRCRAHLAQAVDTLTVQYGVLVTRVPRYDDGDGG